MILFEARNILKRDLASYFYDLKNPLYYFAHCGLKKMKDDKENRRIDEWIGDLFTLIIDTQAY